MTAANLRIVLRGPDVELSAHRLLLPLIEDIGQDRQRPLFPFGAGQIETFPLHGSKQRIHSVGAKSLLIKTGKASSREFERLCLEDGLCRRPETAFPDIVHPRADGCLPGRPILFKP